MDTTNQAESTVKADVQAEGVTVEAKKAGLLAAIESFIEHAEEALKADLEALKAKL